MTRTEIKQGIISKMEEINDDIILEEVYRILELASNTNETFVFSESQRSHLDKIEQDINAGAFVTHTQSEKDLDKWLK